jgi:hypothetical protein
VGVKINAYRIWVERDLTGSMRICENNIKIYLREVEWSDMDWIGLTQDRDQ